jgi:hypothetical protein
VLVDIVEGVDDPEIVSLALLIWFEGADRVDGILPHPSYFSSKFAGEFCGAVGDWKVNVRSNANAATSSDEEQLVGKVIKGAAKILDDISCDQSKRGRGLMSFSNIVDRFARRSIAPKANFIRTSGEKIFDSLLEVHNVFVGPRDLMLDQHEPFIGGHLLSTATALPDKLPPVRPTLDRWGAFSGPGGATRAKAQAQPARLFSFIPQRVA